MIKKEYTFIDLFAGAGGLSEGFIKAGFSPIAHIEMKKMLAILLKQDRHSTICEQKINYLYTRSTLK